MFNYDISEKGVVSILLWVLYFIGLYLIFFWISIFLSSDYKFKKSKKLKILKEKNLPYVSVIVPCYNEEVTIERTLDALFEVDYRKDKMKVFCVNDGSTDSTLSILNKLKKKYGFTIIDQKNQGKHNAINNVLKIINTPYFLCLDADSYPDKRSLKILISEFKNKGYASITPLMSVNNPKSFVQRLQWVEYLLNVFFKYLASHIDSMMVISGPFSLYDAKIVNKIGGFRKGYMTEDFEIALRLQKYDYKIGQSNIAKVETTTPPTFKALINQRIRWHHGNFLCMKDYFKVFFFNKKFKDFGIFVFPAMFLSSFFLIFSFFMILYLFIKSLVQQYNNFALVNFDFWIYIVHYSFDFSLYDLNLKTIFLLVFTIIVLLVMFFISAKETNYKITKHHVFKNFFVFVFYLFLFRFLMIYIWLITFKRVIFKTNLKWLR